MNFTECRQTNLVSFSQYPADVKSCRITTYWYCRDYIRQDTIADILISVLDNHLRSSIYLLHSLHVGSDGQDIVTT
jgi:hypothetical protein